MKKVAANDKLTAFTIYIDQKKLEELNKDMEDMDDNSQSRYPWSKNKYITLPILGHVMDFPFFLKPYMGNLFEANKRYGKNERQKNKVWMSNYYS